MRVVSMKEKYFKGGKLVVVPKKEKNKLEVLSFVIEIIKEKGEVFTESEINAIIMEIYSDYSLIRRYLVDYKMLVRDSYGKEYRISDNFLD